MKNSCEFSTFDERVMSLLELAPKTDNIHTKKQKLIDALADIIEL